MNNNPLSRNVNVFAVPGGQNLVYPKPSAALTRPDAVSRTDAKKDPPNKKLPTPSTDGLVGVGVGAVDLRRKHAEEVAIRVLKECGKTVSRGSLAPLSEVVAYASTKQAMEDIDLRDYPGVIKESFAAGAAREVVPRIISSGLRSIGRVGKDVVRQSTRGSRYSPSRHGASPTPRARSTASGVGGGRGSVNSSAGSRGGGGGGNSKPPSTQRPSGTPGGRGPAKPGPGGSGIGWGAKALGAGKEVLNAGLGGIKGSLAGRGIEFALDNFITTPDTDNSWATPTFAALGAGRSLLSSLGSRGLRSAKFRGVVSGMSDRISRKTPKGFKPAVQTVGGKVRKGVEGLPGRIGRPLPGEGSATIAGSLALTADQVRGPVQTLDDQGEYTNAYLDSGLPVYATNVPRVLQQQKEEFARNIDRFAESASEGFRQRGYPALAGMLGRNQEGSFLQRVAPQHASYGRELGQVRAALGNQSVSQTHMALAQQVINGEIKLEDLGRRHREIVGGILEFVQAQQEQESS